MGHPGGRVACTCLPPCWGQPNRSSDSNSWTQDERGECREAQTRIRRQCSRCSRERSADRRTVYLGLLLIGRALSGLAQLVSPIAALLPDWLPGGNILSLLIVILGCFAVGAATRSTIGRVAKRKLERTVFARIPGYELFRGLTQQLVGEGREDTWKPVLAEIEDALVPAFIIEELEDGRCTVFVPSVPSPFAGAVYVLSSERVHPVNATFLQTFQVLSRWGSGSKDSWRPWSRAARRRSRETSAG